MIHNMASCFWHGHIYTSLIVCISAVWQKVYVTMAVARESGNEVTDWSGLKSCVYGPSEFTECFHQIACPGRLEQFRLLCKFRLLGEFHFADKLDLALKFTLKAELWFRKSKQKKRFLSRCLQSKTVFVQVATTNCRQWLRLHTRFTEQEGKKRHPNSTVL